MALQIDFTKDVAARCVERLTEAGYAPNPADDEDAIYTYVGIRHRRVRPHPRTVHKAAYSLPTHLVDGEQSFLSKVRAGEDLWPHQSRKIGRLSIEDGMLNDYGIQHFHLGTVPDPRHPHLVAGTEELLFAIVKDSDFYVIGLYDHNAWTKQALLDVVHATWPSITEPYTLKGVVGLSRNYTDDEAAKLRAVGINVIQQRPDGRIQMGMGGGIAANGTSVTVRRETDRLMIHIEKLQKLVVAALNKEVESGHLSADAEIHLLWDEDKVHLVSTPPAINFDMSDQLIIPPL